MKLGTCAHESEVKDLLRRGQWPDSAPEETRAHVAGCRSCGELVLVSQAFQQERASATGGARLESAGAVWWRAQLRRRNAALERITRPVLGAQIFAAAVFLVAAAVFLGSQWRRGLGWWPWIAELPRALHLEALLPPALQDGPGAVWILLIPAVMLVLASGLVIYFASEKQ